MKKKIQLLAFPLFALGVLSGCGGNTTKFYNVTFMNDNVQFGEIQKVEENHKATKPTDIPTKEPEETKKYTFKFWSLDKNTEYNFDTPVTSDLTLYAFYDDVYTVTFDLGGSEETVESQSVIAGDYATRPTITPKLWVDETHKYTFIDWREDGSDKAFDFENTQINKNTKIVANWKKEDRKSCTVSFDLDGGKADPKFEPKNVKEYGYCENPGVPEKTSSTSFFTFEYWMDSNDNEFNFETTPITGNITLKAKWDESPLKLTVTFDTDGGSTIEPVVVDYNTKVTKPADPTKVTPQYTYTFDHWQDEIGNVFDFNTPITKNITLKAIYGNNPTVNKYTITWQNYDGSSLGTTEVEYGVTPSFTGDTPTKPEDDFSPFNFTGWSPTLVPVTGPQTYVAQFTRVIDDTVTVVKVNVGNNFEFKLNVTATEGEELLVDWGDGSALDSEATHTYQIGGAYTIYMKNVSSFSPDSDYTQYSKIEDLVIGSSVTNIPQYAFKSCSSLKTLDIKGNIDHLSFQTITNCSSLLSLTFSGHINSLQTYSCVGNSALETIKISNYLGTIGSGVFGMCDALKVVDLSEINYLIKSSSGMFDALEDLVIYVKPSVIDLYKADANWSQYNLQEAQ